MARLLRPYVDKHGQEYVSFNCAADRMGADRNVLVLANQRGFVGSFTIKGAIAVKWPQVREEWKKYQSRNRVVVSQSHPTRGGAKSAVAPDEDDDPVEENEPPAGRPGRPADRQAASATATRMTYAAELLRLEYESKLGKLVPADAIESAWRTIAEAVKKAMLTIPDRCAAIIAGDVTVERYHEVHRTLTVEITNALKNLELVDVAITTASKKSLSGKS